MDENRRPIKTRSAGWAKYVTDQLVKRDLSPNQISVASIAFALAGIVALNIDTGVIGSILCALGIQLRLLCNLFDGMVAIEGGKKSDIGSLYNEFPDRIADSLLIVGLGYAIGKDYPMTVTDIPGPIKHFQVHLKLADGSPVTIDVRPSMVPLSPWLPVVLLGQLLLMILCTWLAVRIAIRPLTRLAQAVETLDPNTHPVHLDEKGPTEVAHAAKAFNAMQARIAAYLKERMQLLAAISHDLQTPITRMKLRAEFMDDSSEKDKLWNDLGEMEHLVREGVAYARSIHGATEESRRTDLDSFLDSLVFDYQDVGKDVQLSGKSAAVIDTRPHALRRVLVNLTDNALKFAGAAELRVQKQADGNLSIKILDRGPGIAEEELKQVMEPFYRVENSRNRSTGGTGLGLAIAQQLAVAIGGSLTLSNREGGGLCAELRLPGQKGLAQG